MSLESIYSLFHFVGDLTLSLSLLFMQDTSVLGQVSQLGTIRTEIIEIIFIRQLFTRRTELPLPVTELKGKVQE